MSSFQSDADDSRCHPSLARDQPGHGAHRLAHGRRSPADTAELERAISVRTAELKTAILACLATGHASVYTCGPYSGQLTIDCMGNAMLSGTLPELVDERFDSEPWGQDVSGCFARCVACAEKDYLPALEIGR